MNTKRCTKCEVAKATSEFSRQARAKDGLQPRCKSCFALYRAENRERLNAMCREYHHEHRERLRVQKAERYAADPELQRARAASYRDRNKEKLAAKRPEYYRKNLDRIKAYREANKAEMYRRDALRAKANPEKHAAKTARRRAAKAQRTVGWADVSLIAQVYGYAKWLEEVAGVPCHVDHIVPLLGKEASGLHVANNLQVLSGSENSSKGVALPDDPLAVPCALEDAGFRQWLLEVKR